MTLDHDLNQHYSSFILFEPRKDASVEQIGLLLQGQYSVINVVGGLYALYTQPSFFWGTFNCYAIRDFIRTNQIVNQTST